jgi:hypothetical protein
MRTLAIILLDLVCAAMLIVAVQQVSNPQGVYFVKAIFMSIFAGIFLGSTLRCEKWRHVVGIHLICTCVIILATILLISRNMLVISSSVVSFSASFYVIQLLKWRRPSRTPADSRATL